MIHLKTLDCLVSESLRMIILDDSEFSCLDKEGQAVQLPGVFVESFFCSEMFVETEALFELELFYGAQKLHLSDSKGFTRQTVIILALLFDPESLMSIFHLYMLFGVVIVDMYYY